MMFHESMWIYVSHMRFENEETYFLLPQRCVSTALLHYPSTQAHKNVGSH